VGQGDADHPGSRGPQRVGSSGAEVVGVAHPDHTRTGGERGFATDAEENTIGIHCFAVAVGPAPRSDAISCSVPVARLTPDMRRAILTALRGALERLGSRTWEAGQPR
jgi:hypothetical protein